MFSSTLSNPISLSITLIHVFLGLPLPLTISSKPLHWNDAAEGLKFGNNVFWIHFDDAFEEKKFKPSCPFGIKYNFHLEDAVDCPEWVVPFPLFKLMAEEYELELLFAKNSHEFVDEYMKKPDFVELMRRIGALGDGNQDHRTISPDEWEVAYLYLTFVLRKRGQPNQTQGNKKREKGKLHLEKEDITYV